MKTLMGGLTLAVMLLITPTVQAEFVSQLIDGFDSAASTGVVGTTRSALTGTAFFKSVAAGSLISTAFNVGDTVSWTLNVPGNPGGIKDPGILGRNHYLKLIGLNNLGTWNLTVTASGTGGQLPGGTYTYALATSGDQILDLSLLSSLGHLNGLQKFDFTATVTSTSGGGATLGLDGMAIVPEPATMSLLGLTAIGGFFANRRRKKAMVA